MRRALTASSRSSSATGSSASSAAAAGGVAGMRSAMSCGKSDSASSRNEAVLATSQGLSVGSMSTKEWMPAAPTVAIATRMCSGTGSRAPSDGKLQRRIPRQSAIASMPVSAKTLVTVAYAAPALCSETRCFGFSCFQCGSPCAHLASGSIVRLGLRNMSE